ncbi:MAG: SPOR domain-containing protein [Thiohalomonadaceae bacterium]
MRALFALLVLANLAFFLAYPRDTSLPDETDAQTVSTEKQQLVLIAEIPLADRPGKRTVLAADGVPEEVQATPEDANRVELPAVAQSCYRIEGIPDEKALAAVKSRLQAAGAHLGESGEMTTEKRRYWVVLPRFRSRAQAEPVMDRLRKAGVRDFYFVSSGENRNTISLGLFSSPEAARKRVQELAPLKLKVHTREVVSSSSTLFLEVGWEQSLAELEKAARLSGSPLRACQHAR